MYTNSILNALKLTGPVWVLIRRAGSPKAYKIIVDPLQSLPLKEGSFVHLDISFYFKMV